MTLKQLEAFYWAASLGSFSIAATRLHVTQSTLSKRIAELEAALNVPLFDRSAQRSVLTEHGTRILGHAHKILQFEGEIHELLGVAPRLSGPCRFGVSELTALTWFPKFVARITTNHPDLSLEPYVDLAAGLERRLVRGEIDFAILPQSGEDNPMLTSVPLAVLEFAWMSSPKRIAAGTVLKSEDIARHPILTMTAESRLTATYEAWAASNKIHARRFLACNSLSAIVGLTVADVGISFLPSLFMRNLIEAGQLNAFRMVPELPNVEYCFKWRTDDTRTFISALAQFAKEEVDYTLSLGSISEYVDRSAQK
ncbi:MULTISPECIES: LysR family transcriptional regulator [Pandoraea]|uniref:LysR family transcriptional regulator n=1 Tax=Pandoraea TaxID=93217 RepID=UPI001F5DD27C|nr:MULTISPECIES: LysR family transcriptional regulator [Pandoraea]MCI3206392.1 LysR family transcriptional regulator [Pandoraea sp. LA3]MDN4584420.1 LysR family transcriptional regulator [Pandoraea capi]